MEWFNKERTKAILIFPVITAAMLMKNDEPKDKDLLICAKNYQEGNSFLFI